MHKETVVKAVHFDFPSAVPVVFHINQACWDSYERDLLAKLADTHPCLFPDSDKSTLWYPVTWNQRVSPTNESILTYGLYPQTPADNIAGMMDFLEDVASGGTPWIN